MGNQLPTLGFVNNPCQLDEPTACSKGRPLEVPAGDTAVYASLFTDSFGQGKQSHNNGKPIAHVRICG